MVLRLWLIGNIDLELRFDLQNKTEQVEVVDNRADPRNWLI